MGGSSLRQSYELMEFAHTWLHRLGVDVETWHQSLGRTKQRFEEAAPEVLYTKVLHRSSNLRILCLVLRDERTLSPASLRTFEQSFDSYVPGLYVRVSLSDGDDEALELDRQRELIPWIQESIGEQLDPVCACFWKSSELERKPEGWSVNLPLDTHDVCIDQIREVAAQVVYELLQDQTPFSITIDRPAEVSKLPGREERLSELMNETLPEPLKPLPVEHTNNNEKPTRRSYHKVGQDGVLWGRFPKDIKTIKIRDFDLELRDAMLEGEVANLETRVVRQGDSLLVKFSLYSREGSIDAQFFMKVDRANEIELLDKFQNGDFVKVFAEPKINSFSFRQELMADVKGMMILPQPERRRDDAPKKRVELHCHTSYSQRDAMSKPASLVRLAHEFGHPAIAITDHGVVQAFPELITEHDRLKRSGEPVPKLIYGMEGYLVNDGPTFIFGKEEGWDLGDSFVAFDLETSGLDSAKDRIIEVGAVRYERNEAGHFRETESFHELCDPGFTPEPIIFELTGLSEMDLVGKRTPHEVIRDFKDFLGEDPIVAHNGLFDLGFLRHEGFRVDEQNEAPIKFNPVLIDTLEWARLALPKAGRHRLQDVAEHFGIQQDVKHRAVEDARTAAEVMLELWRNENGLEVQAIETKYGHLPLSEVNSQRARSFHIVHLAKTRLGLYHLYHLVSLSHIKSFYHRPRIPRSDLRYYQAGLIIGAACEAGEVFRAVLSAWQKHQGNAALVEQSFNHRDWFELLKLYDYLEIQPTINNHFLLRQAGNYVDREEDLEELNRLIVKLAKRYKKLVVATCDAHFMHAEDEIYRRMMLIHLDFSDAHHELPLYFRTTEEMLDAFAYLGTETAYEVVVEATNKIADRVEPDLRPFPEGHFPPIIASAPDSVRRLVEETAIAAYGRNSADDGPGDQLPGLVVDRIDRELTSIIENGFAIMYYIAHLLVKKSNEDGYIVGSRGSVGSSLIATFCGITEVNPLPPHYRCPTCHWSHFDESGTYGSGFDLPRKACPKCGAELLRDGQDIPFETFLGFSGDKQPDIDLNFSGEYQAIAHAYTRELFGVDFTYRAGTITTYAEKNALGIVRSYLEKEGRIERFAEQRRLAAGIDGVKNSTGQHPGGIVVIPDNREIFDFTPIQYPANDQTASMYTTHFDFHALEETILKLDILGHIDPTMLKVLSDYTGVDVMNIPIPDEKVMSLFTSTEALGIPDGTAPWNTSTLGIPELGTFMARGMVDETKPTRFYDLVQLMGLSHGTDVWRGNAQELIKDGTCTIDEVIGCRDSIMTNLIYQGLPSKAAFDIMEHVRKGKGLTEDEEALMVHHGVPEWYIESCKKIKYMFPKAHAAAYVISSLRIAWFKVYHPVSYYAAYFTVRAREFDAVSMLQSSDQVMTELRRLHQNRGQLKDRDLKVYYILELVAEMQLRGIEFLPIDIEHSDAYYFRPEGENKIRPPFDCITGFSGNMAQALVEARAQGAFRSKSELAERAGLGQSSIDLLDAFHVLDGLPDSPQIDLFEFLGEGAE